jgi:hypothetical protein
MAYLENIHATDERCKAREGCSPTATHSDQQHVASWLLQQPADARDVLHGKQEHGQVHGTLAEAVEVREVVLHARQQLGDVRDLQGGFSCITNCIHQPDALPR